jgi:hypothetical protein
MMWNVLVILQRGNLELADRSDEIQKLTGEVYDDDSFHSYLLGFHVDYFQFQLSLFTLRCRFILNDEKATLIHAERFWNFKGLHNPFCYSVFYFLFSALVAIDCWKTAGVTQQFRYWRLFQKFQRLLVAWTKKGDPNTLHLVYLLDAEVLTTKKNVSSMDVQQIYHQSIAQARRSGFIQDAALANERLGEYFLSVQDRDWAQYYLRNAKILYYDWGAKRKVQLMEQRYGSLVEIKVTEADRSKSIVKLSLTLKEFAHVLEFPYARIGWEVLRLNTPYIRSLRPYVHFSIRVSMAQNVTYCIFINESPQTQLSKEVIVDPY